MEYKIPKLEYSYDSLEPYIDSKTMEIHYTKHHQSYVDKLNAAVKKHPELFNKTPEELLMTLDKIPEDIRVAVRNHGGGHVNHSFFWPLLKKDVDINGKILKMINKDFGTEYSFKEKFKEIALAHFGSGWVWLVINDDKLEIMTTNNQDNPLSYRKLPILGLDLWEHAYYLKYQNKRNEYIDAFFNIINWEAVNKNFEKMKNSKMEVNHEKNKR